jgi:hypothetical protein
VSTICTELLAQAWSGVSQCLHERQWWRAQSRYGCCACCAAAALACAHILKGDTAPCSGTRCVLSVPAVCSACWAV